MTTFIEELDDILLTYAKRIESIPRGKTYGWSEERLSILNLVSERIIGRNVGVFIEDILRGDQRTTLYEGTEKSKS